MVNSKRKGQDFENLVYNALLKDGFNVKKPLGSGAQMEPGDIVVDAGGHTFCLECKRYRHLSANRKQEFWLRHRGAVLRYNRSWIPVLIVRLDRNRHYFVYVPGVGVGMRELPWNEFLEGLKK